MTRERIVAAASTVCVNILDDSKLVKHLGERYPLPIEIIPMGLASVRAKIKTALKLEGPVRKKKDATGKPTAEDLISDNGNFIVDVKLTPQHDVERLRGS